MKHLIRIIKRIEQDKIYWHDKYTQEKLRQELNDMGFYVLTGKNESLDVYVIRNNKWWE